MSLLKTVLIVLLTTGLHAKTAKWKTLKLLHEYTESTYQLKEGVEYLELREYTRVQNSKKKMRHTETVFEMKRKPLSGFPSAKVKNFNKLTPILSDQTNIRKFTFCDPNGCVEHVGNAFMIANDGKLWKMNEIADVWNYIEKMDVPAKIQLTLWLYGKRHGTRYRKVSDGYEVIIEQYRYSCAEEYEEYFTYSVHISKQWKVVKEKLLKYRKEKTQCVGNTRHMRETAFMYLNGVG